MAEDGITLELVNSKEVQRDIGRIQDKVMEAAEGGLRSGARIIVNSAKDLAPYFTGTLKRNIHDEVILRTESKILIQIGTNLDYALAIEYGTAPHMPNIDALSAWANRHGLPVWAVAMTIKEKGTKAQPFLRPALYQNEDAFISEVKAFIKMMLQ